MERRLRRYRIKEGHVDDFVETWRAGVLPLRQRLGFVVEGAWVVPDTREFVWIVAFDGDFAAADEAYYQSDERNQLDPDPASFLQESQQDRVVAVT